MHLCPVWRHDHRVNVHEEETIVGTAQMQGSNLLTITNFDTLLFRAEVSESDIQNPP